MMPDEWDSCFLPASMEGLSFLDAGSNDGYFSFEAERRGAREVVAADIYRETDFFSNTSGWPETGIHLAKNILKSRVQVVNCSILNLDTLGKTFDFVFCNNVLAWIRDVPEAIRQLTGVCSGTLLLSDLFNEQNQDHTVRCKFNANTLSLPQLVRQFDDLGWEIFRTEKRNEYQRVLWHTLSFETLNAESPVNYYNDPLDQQVAGQAIIHNLQALMRMNGRLYLNKIGWVDERDVRAQNAVSAPLNQMYREFRQRTGLDRMVFQIRYRNKEKGYFLFAREKQS